MPFSWFLFFIFLRLWQYILVLYSTKVTYISPPLCCCPLKILLSLEIHSHRFRNYMSTFLMTVDFLIRLMSADWPESSSKNLINSCRIRTPNSTLQALGIRFRRGLAVWTTRTVRLEHWTTSTNGRQEKSQLQLLVHILFTKYYSILYIVDSTKKISDVPKTQYWHNFGMYWT